MRRPREEASITSEVESGTAPLPTVVAAGEGTPGWVLGGRYRVCHRIGTGGMAEVFRATDVLLGRDVAVKVFRSMGPTDDPAGAERQELELQALARLSHPHLITLFDASITDTPPYLVMELVEGPSLSERIAQGPVPEPEVRVIGSQIADALSYVHTHDMVHRDVKPANILLGVDGISSDGSGRARLSDFGIVRLLGSERLTAADFTLGTASYLAPEQARGGDVAPAADVYSLGLVLIEALTGVRSFDGPPVEAVLARLSRDPEIPPGLPAPWPALLPAMTARDPQARPSAADVSRALRSGASVAPTSAVPAAAVAAGLAAGAVAGSVNDQATAAIPMQLPPRQPTPPQIWPVAGGAAVPAAGRPIMPVDLDDEYDGYQESRRGRWFAVAALFVLAIIGAASLLAFGTSQAGSNQTPAGSVPSTSQHRAPASHTSTVNANVVAPTVTRRPASTTAHSSSAPPAMHSRPPTTSSVPRTSSAPTTSAPPTTSPVPTPSDVTPTTQAIVAGPPVSSPPSSGG